MSRPVFNKSHIYRITLDAMFVALFVVFATVLSIEVPPIKLSWTSLPVLLCAFLLRPSDAIAVALLGSFLDQMIYGLGAQTIAWILPFVALGIVSSLLAQTFCKDGKLWKVVVSLVVSELVLTALNTLSLYLCGYIMTDVTSPALLIVGFITRTPQALPRIVLSAIFVPVLLKPLRRILSRG